jgi:hypothetical protein
MPKRPDNPRDVASDESLLDLRTLVILVLSALAGVVVGAAGGLESGIVVGLAIALGLHKVVGQNR